MLDDFLGNGTCESSRNAARTAVQRTCPRVSGASGNRRDIGAVRFLSTLGDWAAGFRRGLVVAIIGAAALGAAGCGVSSITSGIGGGMFGGSTGSTSEVKSVTEEQLLSAAKTGSGDGGGSSVAHGCPRFVPWPRDNTLTIYEPGRVGDGLAVMHRGEITKTARECEVANGQVTVKYGFSGRILMGPKGRDGGISLPVTVFVTDAKRERITQEKLKVDAAVSIDKPIGYFSVVRQVTFKVPEGTRPGEFEVFVGFERNVPNAG